MLHRTHQEVQVEVVATSLSDLYTAEQGGIHRIELASALAEGAVTPSYGLMKMAKSRARIPVHVMIRPRPGDFQYSQEEIQIMIEDIRKAVELKADGVITGVLDRTGKVNWDAMDQIVGVAGKLHITFHRAFDECRDKEETLETMLKRYPTINRVMTSGCSESNKNRLNNIKKWVLRFDKRVSIVPSLDVRPDNVGYIVSETGCRDVHTGIWVRSAESYDGRMDIDKVRLICKNANKVKVENNWEV